MGVKLQAKSLDILRFTTAGSVDDGKSTLIGRLLYDSKSIFEDQLAAISKTSAKKGSAEIDLALLTDGLAAEREQGITIDVAYRYFSTPNRKFIIADAPGHEQYTRNMVTGSSTANLAVILIDARKGLIDQTRRHSFISSLLGIKHLVVAVNKMDLLNFSEDVFNKIVEDYKTFALGLNLPDIQFVPISALRGHNVVDNPAIQDSTLDNSMPWYQGPSLLKILETVDISNDRNFDDFRLPVQYVIRVDNERFTDYRGFAGQVVSGQVQVGDELISLPSAKQSRVKEITTFGGNLTEAKAGDAVTIVLEDEIDTSRGDVLVKVTDKLPQVSKEFSANLCWMSEEPMQLRKKYLLKHTTKQVKAMITDIDYKVDINSLRQEKASELALNEIAKVQIKVLQPIICDDYESNRYTGSFIVIDELTNNTVAAGMIVK